MKKIILLFILITLISLIIIHIEENDSLLLIYYNDYLVEANLLLLFIAFFLFVILYHIFFFLLKKNYINLNKNKYEKSISLLFKFLIAVDNKDIKSSNKIFNKICYKNDYNQEIKDYLKIKFLSLNKYSLSEDLTKINNNINFTVKNKNLTRLANEVDIENDIAKNILDKNFISQIKIFFNKKYYKSNDMLLSKIVNFLIKKKEFDILYSYFTKYKISCLNNMLTQKYHFVIYKKLKMAFLQKKFWQTILISAKVNKHSPFYKRSKFLVAISFRQFNMDFISYLYIKIK